jgi:hypothetical protein
MDTILHLILLLVMGNVLVLIVSTLSERLLMEDAISHWHATIPGLILSTEPFYKGLREAVRRQNIKGVEMKVVELPEGNGMGFARPYLRVKRGDLAYYIFAASLGESLYVSSWLLAPRSRWGIFFSSLPLVGWVFAKIIAFASTPTFYSYDSALHFQETMHVTLLKVMDELTSSVNVAPLPSEARKPMMRELYGQPKAPQLVL